jgi:predicted metal-dependent hydrolase
MAQGAADFGRTFRPRPFRRAFGGLSRHWFAGSAVSTQLINGLNLLFPAGERFFVKSVRHFEGAIDDPELRREIRAFYAQEGRHAQAHERYFEEMAAQGYEFAWVIDFIEWLLHRAAPRILSPELRLSITVALEHYTAIMAELPFDHPRFQGIEPAMLELLRWHAAEEIEHKAVAFDVMKRVAPGYRLRLLGFAVATAGLVPIWGVVAASLLAQDRLPAGRIWAELQELRRMRLLTDHVFLRALREYASRDFHPLSNDNYARIQAFLEGFEAAMAPRAA